jgi:hypothetical protein
MRIIYKINKFKKSINMLFSFFFVSIVDFIIKFLEYVTILITITVIAVFLAFNLLKKIFVMVTSGSYHREKS